MKQSLFAAASRSIFVLLLVSEFKWWLPTPEL